MTKPAELWLPEGLHANIQIGPFAGGRAQLNISSICKDLNFKKKLLQYFPTKEEQIDKRLAVYGVMLFFTFAGFFFLETSAHRTVFYLLLATGLTLPQNKQTIYQLCRNFPYIFIAATVFLIFNSISFFWSTNTDLQSLLDILRLPIIILLFITSFITACKIWPPLILLLEAVFIGTAATVAIYLLFNYMLENSILSLGEDRLLGLGLSRNSNILSRLYAFAIFVVLFGTLSRNTSLRKDIAFLRAAITFLFFAVVFFTGSRGTVLALFGTLLFVSLAGKNRFGILTSSLVLVCGVVFLTTNPEVFRNLVERGDALRFEIWEQAWTYIKEAPFFGYGIATEFGFTIEGRPDRTTTSAHNIVLGALLYGGVAGLLSMLWLGILAVFASFRIGQEQGIWLPFSLFLFGAIATQFSGHTLFLNINDEWWYSWIPLAYLLALLLNNKDERQGHESI